MVRKKIAVIGLGYVGLPLAAAFAEQYDVIGFDINEERIQELKSGFDRTLELDEAQLTAIRDRIVYSNEPDAIRECQQIGWISKAGNRLEFDDSGVATDSCDQTCYHVVDEQLVCIDEGHCDEKMQRATK
jgi:6-phosphogluconate dehydrogenase (decarboxylating)